MARRRQRAKARTGHKKNQRYHPLPKALACMVAACFAADAALANPVGPTVVNGQVTFNSNGQQLTIANTPGSIINWQGFSIGVGELTRFIQQSASSAVLNRVVGIDPSVILGALQSNGRVFLINPNGILFGAGSQINVAGLVASTLNLSDADFLAGKLNFTATTGAGSVVNQGAITTPGGGQVYLIAPDVQNSGVITSPQGEIILAAGHSVELVDAGTPNLQVEVTASDEQALNLGQIIADSGKIGIYAGLIKNSGTLQANGVVIGQNGEILLKAVNTTTLDSGSKITATGAQGGTVEVLGNTVDVKSGATVDVSGQNGGGTILVGGDEHGANPDVQNAQFTTVESGASLIADATGNGDGGKVIVWSDDTTKFDGFISARGGPDGGNGGFAEVSGEQDLYLTGHADLRAPHGQAGTLLLDPGTVTIIDGAEGDLANTFSDSYINFQLGFSELTITTSSGTTGALDINFNSNVNINWSSGTTLEFDSGNNINHAGSITSTDGGEGAGTLILNAGGALNLAGTINSAGTVELASGTGNLTQTAGTITAQYLSLSSNNHDASLPDANAVGTLAAQVGTLNFNNTGPLTIGIVDATNGGVGDVTHFTMYGVDVNNGSATITTTGALTVNQQVSVYSNGSNGESASLTLSGNGILIDGSEGGYIYVYGADNDGSGSGGNATVTLNGGAGGITVTNGGYYGYVEAYGGDGGEPGNSGGNAFLTLNGASVNFMNGAYAEVEGGDGYYYGGATNGGSGNLTVNAGAGGINLNNGYLYAYGGEGNNGGTGGAANIQLNASGGLTVSGDGEIYARGGYGYYADGGGATVNTSVGTLTLGDGGEGSGTIFAYGGYSDYTGNGGAATINLGSGAGGITINNGYIEASGGEGASGSGGAASIALNTSGAISILENVDYAMRAYGGYGDGGNGGDATIMIGNSTPPSSITMTTMGIEADGGEGVNGGNATVSLASSGAVSVLGDSYIASFGGEGYDGNGGAATTTLTGGSITLQNIDGIYANGGGDSVTGGAASVTLNAGAGGITINNSTVEADGGENSGTGGAATIFLNTSGAVALSNSGIYAYGGEGSAGNGGDATVAILAGGGISDTASEEASIEADGGYAYGGNGGNAGLYLLSTNGNILIDGDDIDAYGGGAYDSGFFGGKASAAVVAFKGNVTIQDDGYLEVEGGYASDSGSGGAAVAALNAGGGVLLQGDSYVEAYGGYDGSEGYANAQVLIGSPLLNGAAFPLLSGVVLPTPAAVTFDNDAGAYAYGTSSLAFVNTTGDLGVTNGSYVEAYSPLANDGTVFIDAHNVNVRGGSGDFTGSEIYAGSEIDMIVEGGGTVHIDAGGGEGSSAQIAVGSPDTIHIHFFGPLTSGGYFVNGTQGTIYDAATDSGFVVNGVAAILNNNLFIDYTNPSSSSTPGLPPDVTAALNYIISEINQNNGNTGGNNEGESDDDKKKKSCS